MKTLIPICLLLLGCSTLGCKDKNGNEMPEWEGSFCDFVDGGVTCDQVFYAYGSPEFKKLWITTKKGVFCLHKQFVNNCDVWDDPSQKCDYKETD